MGSYSTFLGSPTSLFDDDETMSQGLRKLVSPTDAEELIPKGSPPNTPPQSAPGQSTPRTGSLDYAPTQAQPKRSGPDMLPGLAALLESVGQASNPGTVPAAMQASTAGSLQPVAPAPRPDTRNVVVRDMNGESLGTAPRNAMPALRPAIAQALSARMVNGSAAQPQLGAVAGAASGSVQQLQPAVQPAVMPYQPGRPLAVQQAQRVQAYNSGPGPAQYAASQVPPATDPMNPDPNASLRPGGTSAMGPQPLIPPGNTQINGPSQLDRDQAARDALVNSGPPVRNISSPWVRRLAEGADIAGSIAVPRAMQFIPQSTLGYQRNLGIANANVAQDQSQSQAAAQLANTRSQMNERDAMGRRYDAQANLYNPEPMSAGQAQALGHPEWEGLKLDSRDAERLVGGAARNQTTLQTHFGGQQRTISADDAAAIGTPSLEGASMSNDEYQRLLQGAQRNAQSGSNNAATNATRVQTTGMRDQTSTANSERIHPGGVGAPKPIPAGVRDRIESQKNTAINKARAAFDNGESSMDDYLDAWQSGQNDYEDRLSAQTGGPIPHTDIRSNVDAKGNWIGNRSAPATAQPQTGGQPSFVTPKGNKVALGDRVNVAGRSGVVAGFNARTGKAQVKWDSRN